MSDKLIALLCIMLVFLVGIFTGALMGPINFDSNIPTANTIKEKTTEIVDTLNFLNSDTATERDSPYDWVKTTQVEVFGDRVIIDLKNAEWATFTDTNSMDPVLDEDSIALQVIPKTVDDIHLGDIVSYIHPEAGRIIHRVVYKGNDENGIYFVMKGDNNPTSDPDKVRFEQIKTVTVAIIY